MVSAPVSGSSLCPNRPRKPFPRWRRSGAVAAPREALVGASFSPGGEVQWKSYPWVVWQQGSPVVIDPLYQGGVYICRGVVHSQPENGFDGLVLDTLERDNELKSHRQP